MNNTDWRKEFENLATAIHDEFPSMRIRIKAGFFMGLLNILTIIFTFGVIRDFKTHYTTTIGNTIWVPIDWKNWEWKDNWAILIHEWQHLKQRKSWCYPAWLFCYLLVPLFIFFAWYRYKWERQAFTYSMAAYYYIGGKIELLDMKFWVVEGISGSNYLWAWPKNKVGLYMDKVSQKVTEVVDRNKPPLEALKGINL